MRYSRLIIALLPLTLLLSACEKTDTDLVMDFVNSWLESRGAIYKAPDGSYKPTLKGIGVATGFTTTGDEQADAAVQSGKMVKDIAENDKLMRDGETEFNKNPPNVGEAKKKMDTAVSNRPDDWYYRNHRAFMNLRLGDDKAAQKDLKAGADGCGGNANCLAALHRDRATYYTGMELGVFMTADQSLRQCSIVTMGAESYQYLADASTGSDKTSYQNAAKTANDQKKSYCK